VVSFLFGTVVDESSRLLVLFLLLLHVRWRCSRLVIFWNFLWELYFQLRHQRSCLFPLYDIPPALCICAADGSLRMQLRVVWVRDLEVAS
jgi:hypothetical protein